MILIKTMSNKTTVVQFDIYRFYNFSDNSDYFCISDEQYKIFKSLDIPHQLAHIENVCCTGKFPTPYKWIKIVNLYNFHYIPKTPNYCIHWDTKRPNTLNKNKITCFIEFEQDDGHIKLETVTFNVIVSYQVHILIDLCSEYIAKCMYNSLQYILCKEETIPPKLLFLRDLKKLVNRDIFKIVEHKVHEMLQPI